MGFKLKKTSNKFRATQMHRVSSLAVVASSLISLQNLVDGASHLEIVSENFPMNQTDENVYVFFNNVKPHSSCMYTYRSKGKLYNKGSYSNSTSSRSSSSKSSSSRNSSSRSSASGGSSSSSCFSGSSSSSRSSSGRSSSSSCFSGSSSSSSCFSGSSSSSSCFSGSSSSRSCFSDSSSISSIPFSKRSMKRCACSCVCSNPNELKSAAVSSRTSNTSDRCEGNLNVPLCKYGLKDLFGTPDTSKINLTSKANNTLLNETTNEENILPQIITPKKASRRKILKKPRGRPNHKSNYVFLARGRPNHKSIFASRKHNVFFRQTTAAPSVQTSPTEQNKFNVNKATLNISISLIKKDSAQTL